jgi:hypothetical protein
MATIRIKRGTTDPTAAQVTNSGELAANTSTPKIWLKTADDGTTTPIWVGAQIENSSTNGTTWTSDVKLATKKAIGDYFMPLSGGTFTSDVSFSGGADIRFIETGGGTDYVAFQAPSAIASSVTWTLPNADGSNGQFLKTNGTGTLSWADPGTATSATNLAGGSTGAIPYQSATSTTTFLSAGTSGDILTYGGSNAPAWSSGTGTGSPVRATSPTLTTPTLGVATATSINKVAITAPATSATLTIADGKTLTASNTLTFTGTDSSSVAFGTGGTVAYQGGTLAQFASTTSSQLAGVISDETGSGALVFGTSPTFTTAIDGGASFSAFASSTTLTVGYNSTAASTTNISTGAVASATTKTINIGTGGAAGSTTNINLGSSNGGTVTVNKDLVVSGDLTVNGTTTTINSTTISVDDKNIELGSVGTPSNTTADGGGITLKGATDKTLNWVNATGAWTSSEDFNLLTGKVYEINGTTVLSSSALGTGVTGSSLTSVGTITTGVWNGTDIGLADGGTNASLTAVNGGIVYSTASAMAISAAGTSNQVLLSGGAGAPTWAAQSSLSVGSATTATTATNVGLSEATSSDSTALYLTFVASGASGALKIDATAQAGLAALSYVPSTGVLTAYKVEAIVDGGTY